MLPKRQRLKRVLFNEVSKGGRRLFSPYFSVVFKRNQESQGNSFAVVISKKMAQKAAMRNLIRRRVYHIFYELDQAYNSKVNPPFSVIFYVRNEKIAKIPFSVLKKEIKDLFEKIKTQMAH